MTNYAAQTDKAAKKFDQNPENIQKGVASLADTAESFVKDTAEHVSDAACEATKYIKDEGQKNLRMAEQFVKDHPTKGILYALGIGAALSYLFMPRR